MANPRRINDQYVYHRTLRQTSAGHAITIPVDAIKSLRWKAGDSMAVVLLDDGIVVSKIEGEQ